MACNGLINYLLLRRSSEGRRGFYACSIHSKFEKDIWNFRKDNSRERMTQKVAWSYATELKKYMVECGKDLSVSVSAVTSTINLSDVSETSLTVRRNIWRHILGDCEFIVLCALLRRPVVGSGVSRNDLL